MQKKTISRNKKPIIIGKFNWFACKTCVKKGVITPDYTIVTSANSLLCKDYSDIEQYSVLGGIPAKVIGKGIRRVYSYVNEAKLNEYFSVNTDKNEYKIEMSDEEIDSFCLNDVLNM